MLGIPNSISSRELFWIWYDKLTLEQRKTIVQDYNRFVAQVELEANLQEMLMAQSMGRQFNQGWTDTWAH
ncbi:MAG: hypothetical protein SFW36_17250 [Leptolyngbyaceae cyanobacterium bins.59]|nr:hypothetical protein [Leptolyngbyaceae cyanobacterium bins.59]